MSELSSVVFNTYTEKHADFLFQMLVVVKSNNPDVNYIFRENGRMDRDWSLISKLNYSSASMYTRVSVLGIRTSTVTDTPSPPIVIHLTYNTDTETPSCTDTEKALVSELPTILVRLPRPPCTDTDTLFVRRPRWSRYYRYRDQSVLTLRSYVNLNFKTHESSEWLLMEKHTHHFTLNLRK